MTDSQLAQAWLASGVIAAVLLLSVFGAIALHASAMIVVLLAIAALAAHVAWLTLARRCVFS